MSHLTLKYKLKKKLFKYHFNLLENTFEGIKFIKSIGFSLPKLLEIGYVDTIWSLDW